MGGPAGWEQGATIQAIIWDEILRIARSAIGYKQALPDNLRNCDSVKLLWHILLMCRCCTSIISFKQKPYSAAIAPNYMRLLLSTTNFLRQQLINRS
jgi:hypothetical protein